MIRKPKVIRYSGRGYSGSIKIEPRRHVVIQLLIDLLCVAWWAGFAGVTALGIAWAVFVCFCVSI